LRVTSRNWIELAAKHEAAGKLEQAAEAYRHALELDQRNPAIATKLGLILGTLNRFEEAERCLCKAVAADPAHAEAHGHLGVVLARLGRHQEAVEHYRRAIE